MELMFTNLPSRTNMGKMKIAIIVLNYNGIKNTLACLDSLKRLKTGDYQTELIVVDNASTDGSAEALLKLKDIELIVNDDNFGYSKGNNIGIKEALARKAQLVLILNNDTLVKEDMLLNLINAQKWADIVSPKIYFAPGFEFHKQRYKKADLGKVVWYAGATIDWDNIIGVHEGVDRIDKGQFEKRKEIDLATGAAMMVKSQVFEKIGFFDEKYFLYLEDMDFCVRAKKAGFKIVYEPKAILWHKNAGSTGGSGSSLQDYYFSRNRLLFAAKYARFKTKLAVLKEIFKKSQNPVKKKALLDFLMLKFGKAQNLL